MLILAMSLFGSFMFYPEAVSILWVECTVAAIDATAANSADYKSSKIWDDSMKEQQGVKLLMNGGRRA